MFNQIEAAEARQRDWDLVIAGSSFAAMFFLKSVPTDFRVLIVEKGPFLEHYDFVDQREVHGLEDIEIESHAEHRKNWVAHSTFGGNSNCWWGQTPRFLPSDFDLRSRYGVGMDWPISYDEIEPFYSDVESIMQIAGGGRNHLSPMSRPYPFPPHIGTLSDKELWNGVDWVPVATARSNGGGRAQCCSNNVCHLCPLDAKFTILNSRDLFARDNLSILANAEVRRATDLQKANVTGVEVFHNGQSFDIKADRVALATNALFNAAILLRSGDQNDLTGRYIHEQASKNLALNVPNPNYFGGTSITGHNYRFYDGDHRSEHAAVLIENFNIPRRLRTEKGKVTNTMSIKLIAEDIPQARNRVVLDDTGAPKVIWHGHHEYAGKGIANVVDRIPEIFPWDVSINQSYRFNSTEAHIQGTCRMGESGDSSVVDSSLRKHGNTNLWILGASAFPSCSPANPTLTLSALSLMAGRSIV